MFKIERQPRFALILGRVVLGWAIVAGPIVVGSSAFAAELGTAVQRDVPQDISGWQLRAPISAEAPIVSPPTTRDMVVQLYNNVYLPGNSVALIWTGSIAGCVPGTTNLAHQQAVIDRVNYYRALVELPGVTLVNDVTTTQAQASALMMSAANALSHTPGPLWPCYSSAGATGAGSSNLTLGINGVGGIDLYMVDPGTNNTAAGHRRWVLYPPRASMATGDIPSSGPNFASNDLFVFGPTTTRPATPNGIAWPPAGFVPYQNLPSKNPPTPSDSNRWSFSFPGANFSAATVTMSGPNGPTPIPVTLETVLDGYGDNTIVFLPTGFTYGNPGSDKTYTILVSGMTGAGVPASIQYNVTVIDPVALTPAPPTLGSVASRKVHGTAGTFDLTLGLLPTSPTIEPRIGLAPLIVFTFDKPVTAAGAVTVTPTAPGTATAGIATFSGNEIRVPLTNVSDQQYVTITVSNVTASDGGTGGGGSVRVGFLNGDVNQNRQVTSGDRFATNAVLGQAVSTANFLKDVNVNGFLTSGDNFAVNNQAGHVLPSP